METRTRKALDQAQQLVDSKALIHEWAGSWGDMTVLQYLGQGLADRKEQRIRDDNRLDRGGVALDPDLTAEIKALSTYAEDGYNAMLMAEYQRRVPENVRKWAATIPGLATGELFPRIISAIGHPRIATPRHPDPDDPKRKLIADPAYIRGPQELRQYAGAGDPQRKPFRGMSQEELFAMGKIKQVRPLLFTWSTNLVKMSTPAKEGSKHPGEPKSMYAASSKWWEIFVTAKRVYAGHDGKCEPPSGGVMWPLGCAETHRRHQWQCQNKKIPPARPNGCGIGVHPEWGEPGSPWRPGHIDMAAHRRLHQKLLNHLWEVAGEDGLTPYEFQWKQDFQGFRD